MSKDKHRGRARILRVLALAEERWALPVNKHGYPQTWLPVLARVLKLGLLERRRYRDGGLPHTRRTVLHLTEAGRQFLNRHRHEVPARAVDLGGFRRDLLARQRSYGKRFWDRMNQLDKTY